jgi:hypothetical protein
MYSSLENQNIVMLHHRVYPSLWGRASVGGVYTALIPARLLIKDGCIELKAFLGTYCFPEKFVISIEKIADDKVSIHHVVHDYPSAIIFTGKNVFHEIQKTGFSPSAHVNSLDKIFSNKIFLDNNPLKLWVFVSVPSIWYVHRLLPWDQGGRILLISTVAIYTVSCVTLLLSKEAQKMVLKPERRFSEIRCAVVSFAIAHLILLLFIIAEPALCMQYEFICEPDSPK